MLAGIAHAIEHAAARTGLHGRFFCCCCPAQTENIRIAYIDEIPPGTSQVSFKLFVPQEQYDLGPLSLQGFKVSVDTYSC